MRKSIKIILKTLGGLIIVIPLVLLLLVRFTNGTISSGDKIVLGYAEDHKRFQFFDQKTFELNGLDGPYLIDNKLFQVEENNEITESPLEADSILVRVNNDSRDNFYVNLRREHIRPESTYQLPEKVIVISDIEGNFNGFSSFLLKNNVIDENFNWSFENGHLVLVGDFVDWGGNVMQTLWLIYKLEQQAEKQGGQVHFILGNHEIMNIQGDWRYARDKYKKLATEIGGLEDARSNYQVIFSKRSELGKWMRSKNIAERLGPYLFVHAGISPEILDHEMSIEEMNTLVRENIDKSLYRHPEADEKANFLMGRFSPYWYRGLVIDYKYYDKIKEDDLDKILDRYSVKKIVIGHTVVEDISTDYHGKVIRIDLKHGTEKNSGKTKGLWIEDGREFQVDDLSPMEEIR